MKSHRIIAAAAALAVAAAPAAVAKKGGDKPAKGKGQEKAKKVVLKGTVVSADEAAKSIVVTVTKSGGHGKSVSGDQTFTVTKVIVGDRNADTLADLNDVQAGDKVVVHTKITKGVLATTADKVIDQTFPPADEAEPVS